MTREIDESWAACRRRMLDQTARFIEWGLHHPDAVIEIPAKPAGEGGFPPGASRWFWSVVLTTRRDARTRRWLDFLRRRPKGLWRRRR